MNNRKILILTIIMVGFILLLCYFIKVDTKEEQVVYIHDYKLLNYYTVEVLEEEIVDRHYLDIPLSEELQDYTMDLAEQYDIPFELLIAIMEVESNFRADIISVTNDFGIMQINKVNHRWLKDELGVRNLLNPEENILAGTHMVAELYHKYDGNLHKTLMSYNMGQAGARKLWDKGIYKSKYSNKVVDIFEINIRATEGGGGKS